MAEHIDVMISSTARDLPDHRAQVSIAIQKSSMYPLWMETLPALDADAIKASLDMVDKAEIYIGIFAHRYGYVPAGHTISVTEMEYNRAIERGIPRLIFFMHKDHPINIDDVEMGEGAAKLKALKERIGTDRVANFFKSPEDLRGQVLDALVDYRKGDSASTLHSNLDIPRPPEPYIAHAYSLLQAKGLIGRQVELGQITDWATARDHQPMLNIVAIGGMGKSALTWKWFNEVAPKELKLAGSLWWSFYESNATWENFVIRALAYVSGRDREYIEKNIPPGEREDMLWQVLNTQPFLLVLDGLERVLIAYARADAVLLADDRVTSERRARKTADPRAGAFLRRLLTVKASRVLVSTRLFPAELETDAGEPRPGCARIDLLGLSDADAVDLWRAFGVSGTREQLVPLFTTFGHHPLLIQALAGEIRKDRRANGDYDQWRAANPHFDPARHPTLSERQAHILEYALAGLSEERRRVLHTLAAFRMPTSQQTLDALFVGEEKPFAASSTFDSALRDLEDRGLVGWDNRANRYDLHPIVRGVVWGALAEDGRRGIFVALEVHFQAMPTVGFDDVESLDDLTPAIELYHTLVSLGRYDEAAGLFDDRILRATLYRLSAAQQNIELLERLFPDGLDHLPRLESAAWQAVTLNALAAGYHASGQPGRAVPLYGRHNDVREAQNDKKNLSIGLRNLSDAARLSGSLYAADHSARRALLLSREAGDAFQEAVSLQYVGLARAVRLASPLNPLSRGRGDLNTPFSPDAPSVGAHSRAPLPHTPDDAPSRRGDLAGRPYTNAPDDRWRDILTTFRRAIHIFREQDEQQSVGLNFAYLAQAALWRGEYAAARRWAERAWELAGVQRLARDVIRAACRQGQAALALLPSPFGRGGGGEGALAEERLHFALTKARAISFTEEELPALTALAELRRRQGQPDAARDLLAQVWEGAERGPYPTLHADALNVLAQLERDAGNTDAAIAAATGAHRLAWCDGISADGSQCFAYLPGLTVAAAHLQALGAPLPDDLPPFTMDGREPLPDVEIDPDDKWHVGDRAVEDEPEPPPKPKQDIDFEALLKEFQEKLKKKGEG
ncbi:MAG: DUF4062 domain-containing protein [Anaerolineae bacterium]|nr:DUF4062 domain-containing protein [Anaerolineae bacterium]